MSTLEEILSSDLGAKKKAKALADALSAGEITSAGCIEALSGLSDVDRASVLESFESATRKQPELVDAVMFTVLVDNLAHPAPRVRWEAARAIGNVAKLHPDALGRAVAALVPNAEHEGSVVRWATAHALGAILRTGHDAEALAARMEALCVAETDDAVRGVYDKALRRSRSR